MNLDEFIANLKRQTQYGNPSTETDQAAKDVRISINGNLDRICKNWMWDWLYDPLSITLISGTEDYDLDSDHAKIVDIFAGDGLRLTNISLKEYHAYKKPDAALGQTNEGTAAWYLYIGRNSSTGARKVRIGNIPTSTSTLTGFAKLRLTRFADSDLGTDKSMLPFPVEGEDVLHAFVLADIYRLQDKKDLIFPQINLAEQKLKDWRGEEATEPARDATSKLPPYLRRKLINRSRGYVV